MALFTDDSTWVAIHGVAPTWMVVYNCPLIPNWMIHTPVYDSLS
jgi:hypothetical protein